MNQKEVIRKIGDIIQELNDQFDYLKTVTDNLNDLELELFVSNAHFLASHIEVLRKLNLQAIKIKTPPVEKTETKHEEKYFEPVVQQMKYPSAIAEEKPVKPADVPMEISTGDIIETKEDAAEEKEDLLVPQIDLSSENDVDTYAFQREEPETIRHELILDASINWEDDEDQVPFDDLATLDQADIDATDTIVAEKLDSSFKTNEIKQADIKEPEPPIEKEPEVPVKMEPEVPVKIEPEVSVTVAKEEVLTINQKISSQLGDKAGARTDQFIGTPISDLKAAITLNDKLLYIKDLFNGYNLAYSEAIEILNRFNSIDEATRFLNTNYVVKNNWESKPGTTEKFYALLQRRYA
jgi:hypothetical protein